MQCFSQWVLEWPVQVATPEETPALHGPPLAMFTPGGGKVALPSWFSKTWGATGEQLTLPLEVEFFADAAGSISDEPLRRTRALKLFTRRPSSLNLDLRAQGVAWGLVELSKIEALLVWCIDMPDGAKKGSVSLPAGSRLFCSTQVWKGDELQRLHAQLQSLRAEYDELRAEEWPRQQGQAPPVLALKASADARAALEARIRKLERGLPQPGAPTMEVPGPWPGTVTISTHGQLAVQRLTQGRLPNPLASIPEFGVVGSFELTPLADHVDRLESEVVAEVEVLEREW